jgi:general secretion pathway protein G
VEDPRRRLAITTRLRLRSESGLTLAELLIVMAIIATISAIAVPIISDFTERARIARTIADIKVIESEIAVFDAQNGRLPTTLAEINRSATRDAWGRPYEYLSFAGLGPSEKNGIRKDHNLHPLNSTYDLYSKGQDGDSKAPLTAKASRDDIIRANDGGYVGLAANY